MDWQAIYPVLTLLLGVGVTAFIDERRSRAGEDRSERRLQAQRLYELRMRRLADTRVMVLAMIREASRDVPLDTDEPGEIQHPLASIRLLGDRDLVHEYIAVMNAAATPRSNRERLLWIDRVTYFRDRCLRALSDQEERVALGQEPLIVAVDDPTFHPSEGPGGA